MDRDTRAEKLGASSTCAGASSVLRGGLSSKVKTVGGWTVHDAIVTCWMHKNKDNTSINGEARNQSGSGGEARE